MAMKEKKKKVASLEEIFTQCSPATPDGNQVGENDRESCRVRIYPFSCGKLPTDNQYEKGDARLLILSVNRQDDLGTKCQDLDFSSSMKINFYLHF